jgi:glyoxylase-like metal-dependent hydrolase (beta-lactamase superfamily II)
MLLRQYFDHESFTYTYLIADKQQKVAALIDPVSGKTSWYMELLAEMSLSLVAVLDTHTHADHISANGALRKLTNCKTYLGFEAASDCVDHGLLDGETILIGALSITAIKTPGHTDDSYSFHLHHEQQDYLFTGDTLLIRGSGRTDFQNGDAIAQYHSIKQKLLSYPDNTIIYPGHDYHGRMLSTVFEERHYNPRLQVNNAEQYADIMTELNLPSPKMMDVAVPANKACGQVK